MNGGWTPDLIVTKCASRKGGGEIENVPAASDNNLSGW